MFRWLRRSPVLTAPAEGSDSSVALLHALTSRISTPQRAASVLARVAAFEKLSPEARTRELPAVYLLCEHYLVELDANPTDRDALRGEVKHYYEDLLEDEGFDLIFRPAALQEVLLCRSMLQRILERAAETLGTAPGQALAALVAWAAKVPLGTPDRPPMLPESEEFDGPEAEGDWIELLCEVSEALYQHLETALGERSAARIYEASYQDSFEAYSSLDSFPVVVGMLPERLLDEDKIVLLSRRQVQRVVLDKVERLQRINERLSHQNEELLRVEEMLRSARDDLEGRIIARTEELRSANESLRREVAERQRADEALRQSEMSFRSLIENGSDIIFLVADDGALRYVSPSVDRALGYSPELLMGRDFYELVDAASRETLKAAFVEIGEGKDDRGGLHARVKHQDGTWRTWEVRGKRLLQHPTGPGIVVNAHDITERKQLEEQLAQAQKMEAIGRLAGGVAHDFNNLLTAIKGHLEFLLEDLPNGSTARSDAEEIGHAADRAAALTGQLLAFSRKQVLQPKVIDLNKTVGEMDKMLRRVIGEDVVLTTEIDPDLGRVTADPGQIAQVILNLAVNARDAMPEGGRLTIGTANVELDEEYARGKVRIESGQYVMLAVSDTGTGMDEATQARIFEPFYTTKAAGEGTGLGLSTVYGIVQQSGGNVWVYSEVGRGTTFKVYLPRVDAPATVTDAPVDDKPLTGGEVVLLVEDEPSVRALARRVLEHSGYRVLEAERGETALRLAADEPGAIQLLLTDVVMPGRGGREIAQELQRERPDLQVLFMSGYTDDAILRHGMLAEGTPFIEKPFTPTGLLRKVREVLDRKSALAG